jgi:hypothetical protein
MKQSITNLKNICELTTSLTPWSWVLLEKAPKCLATQEYPNILWNPTIHYHVHNSPPLIPILSQIKPVHTTTSYFSKIHFNIILTLTSRSSYWTLSFCIHLVVNLWPMWLTTGHTYDHKKKIINKWTLMSNNSQRLNISFKMLCVVIVRYMKKKETNCSNKAQHVPHQENISYLNPRTWPWYVQYH